MKKFVLSTKYDTYPEMVDSGVDWIGKIPNGWNVVKVKNIFSISKERIKGDAKQHRIYSLTQKGLKERDISLNDGQIAASYDAYARLRENDIVLNPMDLKTGFVAKQRNDGIISPAYTNLRTFMNVDTDYYERYFQFHYFYDIFFPFGTGVSVDFRWTLGNETLRNFPIISNPIVDQQKIASFLDKRTVRIDAIIGKKKELIDLLKEKRAALIHHAVTKGLDPDVELVNSGLKWIGKIPKGRSVQKLAYVVTRNDGGVWGDEGDEISGVPVLRSTDIEQNGKWRKLSPAYRILGHNESHAGLLQENDLLVTKSSGSAKHLGKTGLVSEEMGGDGYYFSNFMQRLRVNSRASSQFVFYILNGPVGRGQIPYWGLTTSGIINLNHDLISLFQLPVPDLGEQSMIVDFLDKRTVRIDAIIEKNTKTIQLLKEYRASLIHNAVTGKIKV